MSRSAGALARQFVARVAAQASLALTSFAVSITAAHALTTDRLAAFYAAWAIESLFIAAIRMMLLPAFILSDRRPGLFATMSAGALGSLPFAGISLALGSTALGALEAVALALTCLTLGVYESARTWIIGRGGSSVLLTVSDTTLLALTLLGVGLSRWVLAGSLLEALVVINVAACVGCSFVVVFRSVGTTRRQVAAPIMAWFKDNAALLRLHVVEWGVFFAVSTASLALLGLIGGPKILAGVRLGETLAAPIGLLGSAIPLIVASYMDSVREERLWSRGLRLVTVALVFISALWLVLLQAGPDFVVSALAGDHVAEARAASLGLALGALASIYIEVASLLEKKVGHLRLLHWLRWGQVATLIPVVGAGALGGSVFLASLAVSVQQLIPAVPLAVHGRRGHTSRRNR